MTCVAIQSEAAVSRVAPRARRGISLLEVLIAIGILAIGLTSVVALVPAGRSQAARAVVLDRASVLAANALTDAATFGLLRPDVLTGTTGLIVIDPTDPTVAAAAFSRSGTTSGAAWMRTDGIFSTTTDPSTSASTHELFTRSRDDIVFAVDATNNEAFPLNSYDLDDSGNALVRAFQGRMTCLYGIRFGTPGTLSAVVFHSRDPSTLAVTGTIVNGAISTASLLGLGDRNPREVLKPGMVCYGGATNPRFHQAISVAFPMLDSTQSTASIAYVTFSTGTALLSNTHTLTIFPDSVGLAERTFTAETSGPYLQ